MPPICSSRLCGGHAVTGLSRRPRSRAGRLSAGACDPGVFGGEVDADGAGPVTLLKARSTRPAQLAQVMPAIGRSK